MSAKHERALTSARPDLLKSVIIVEQLLSELISKLVITKAMKDEIDVSSKWCHGE